MAPVTQCGVGRELSLVLSLDQLAHDPSEESRPNYYGMSSLEAVKIGKAEDAPKLTAISS
jgi:hypothetical protein